MYGETIVIKLQQQLNSEENKKYYRYLLIDMLGITSELSELYAQRLKQTLPKEAIQVVKRPELLHDLSSCPHLICIGQPNQTVNQNLLNAALWQIREDFLTTKAYICGWLVSDQSIDELSEILVEIGTRLGRLTASTFIPFYEPFRLQLLQDSHATDPNWIGSLFPANSKYYYIDLQQQLRMITNQENKPFTQLFLDQKIVFFQQESKRLFRLYVLWYELKERQGQPIKTNELIDLINYYYNAHLLGLTDIEDRTIFVFFSLKYGDLLQNQKIREIIEEVVFEDPGSLSARFLAIDAQFPVLFNNYNPN
jgi:hypothetical protein